MCNECMWNEYCTGIFNNDKYALDTKYNHCGLFERYNTKEVINSEQLYINGVLLMREDMKKVISVNHQISIMTL